MESIVKMGVKTNPRHLQKKHRFPGKVCLHLQRPGNRKQEERKAEKGLYLPARQGKENCPRRKRLPQKDLRK